MSYGLIQDTQEARNGMESLGETVDMSAELGRGVEERGDGPGATGRRAPTFCSSSGSGSGSGF